MLRLTDPERQELESTKSIWVSDRDSDWVPSLIISIVPKDGHTWYRIHDWQGYLCATTSINAVEVLLLMEREAQGATRAFLFPEGQNIKVIPRQASASVKKQGTVKKKPKLELNITLDFDNQEEG